MNQRQGFFFAFGLILLGLSALLVRHSQGVGKSRASRLETAGSDGRDRLGFRSDGRAPESRSPSDRSADPVSKKEPNRTPATLAGRLIESQSRSPIAGVHVRLRLRSRHSTLSRQATTDSRGTFQINDVPLDEYTLRTVVKGHQPDIRRVRAWEADSHGEPPVEIILEPGFSINGVAKDPAGQPLQNVQVRWIRRSGLGSGSASAKTDDHGQFILSGLAPGSGVLQAALAGFRPPGDQSASAPTPQAITLVLRRDIPLPLFVFDASGAPVRGAVVRFETKGTFPRRGWADGNPSRWQTDADGRAELAGLPAGEEEQLSLTVEHPNYCRFERKLSVGELQEEGVFHVVLQTGNEIAGTVFDRAGQPAANVRIFLMTEGRPSLVTTSAGSFRFRNLPEKSYSLWADGGTRGHALVEGMEAKRAGSVSRVSVWLQKKNGTIGGIVRNPEGDALSRVSVQALQPPFHFTVYTDRSGRFQFEGIPEGRYHLRVGSRRMGERNFTNVPTGTVDLEVQLTGKGTLSGTVQLAGAAQPFTIRLVPAPQGDRPKSKIAAASRDLSYRFSSATLDFRCPNVPAGNYDVYCERRGEVLAQKEGVKIAHAKVTGPIVLVRPERQ